MKNRVVTLSIEKKRSLFGYVFSAPWIIGFLLFMIYPLIMSFLLSISKITDLEGLKFEFVGFDNYVDIFTKDIDFVPSFINTTVNTFLWLPFIIVFAVFIAMLLNRNVKFKGFFRAVYFLPVLLGSGFIMEQVGSASDILMLPKDLYAFISYYINPDAAEFIQELLHQILSVFWKTGVQIIIFLIGLQSIPDSYYEAAKVDNANGWLIFWEITVPLLSPTILLNVIYTIIDSFRDTNNKIAELIISVVFDNTQFEYGSAMGWVYFITIFVFIGIVLLAFRKKVNYEK